MDRRAAGAARAGRVGVRPGDRRDAAGAGVRRLADVAPHAGWLGLRASRCRFRRPGFSTSSTHYAGRFRSEHTVGTDYDHSGQPDPRGVGARRHRACESVRSERTNPGLHPGRPRRLFTLGPGRRIGGGHRRGALIGPPGDRAGLPVRVLRPEVAVLLRHRQWPDHVRQTVPKLGQPHPLAVRHHADDRRCVPGRSDDQRALQAVPRGADIRLQQAGSGGCHLGCAGRPVRGVRTAAKGGSPVPDRPALQRQRGAPLRAAASRRRRGHPRRHRGVVRVPGGGSLRAYRPVGAVLPAFPHAVRGIPLRGDPGPGPGSGGRFLPDHRGPGRPFRLLRLQ